MTTLTCPDCLQPLPAGSPQWLCPSCLIRQALFSRTAPDGKAPTDPLPPPSLEEISAKFPQFEIAECLGRGGMGVVYKARQKSLNRWVAIKILPPERVGEEKFAERFTRDAQTLARLNHPNIVTVYDYGETAGLFYIVMEFVDGVNLRDLLRDGKLAPEQALAIVPPICEALQFAHGKGIVHRDIKPENLLLDRDGRVKIADFGIATLISGAAETAGHFSSPAGQTRAAGTPDYAAPEQASGQADHRADIYALGVVLYEMLTGERPVGNFAPPSRKAGTGRGIDEMVLRAMEKEPGRRYQSAGEFGTAAATALAHPAVPPPPQPAPPPRGMMQRWWWLFLVMLPVGLVLGVAAAALLTHFLPKKYETHATVEIRPSETSPSSQMMTPQFFGTEFERIKSRRNLGEVVDKLNLGKAWQTTDQQAVQILLGCITAQNIRGTDLIEVRVRDADPVRVVAIANALLEVYRNSGGRTIVVHELPQIPKASISPNERLNKVLGGLAGLLVSPLLALLLMAVLQKLTKTKNRNAR